ncbi:putative transmembrane protein [Toxoplasma gondii TgCatPRC2]|uniref:Transmembrane protein n=14 Tax=Toxoplasma gondii TaxID=5811 RepID=A0A125YNZ6_TOXGV|nr:hypothetical protein TGME49_288245 [Toxoplasma gondii ME49]EPR59869.1 hypothetical protein TGGT1_288245 [Toxoplasma gondii GT1]ESS33831.1 putative transmembrane protein [Toxoplasma gondii VEG]KFG28925.1 putative transmembrane protein [Toxoplasma gondii p89]KFG42953.1 putative transmembrane protein [Toxoplasma gondii GAB2-2007-GAL-DOM2]KFG53185.1 putative transmembrane protein [Toxoplasma gondii FOU]KFG62541.1 putative transmembrane protein [Toxoplasma gondii RUB]KFH08757.1 putative transm|eukprot:XP_018636350.1 hypothetical protein TGME49_288245 [Toxoplasma gondii ME49]
MFALQDAEQLQLQRMMQEKFVKRLRAFAVFVAALRALPIVVSIFSETPSGQA